MVAAKRSRSGRWRRSRLCSSIRLRPEWKRKNQRPLSRHNRSGCRRVRRACRESMSCRSRRKTNFASRAAKPLHRKVTRKGHAYRCCNAWPQWASAAGSTSRRAMRRSKRASRRRPPHPSPSGYPADPWSAPICGRITRYRNTPSGPIHRGWTRMGASKLLCITMATRINWIFQRSCADRRIEGKARGRQEFRSCLQGRKPLS
jgi:hypothetical protein